jgi:hypothetical protein
LPKHIPGLETCILHHRPIDVVEIFDFRVDPDEPQQPPYKLLPEAMFRILGHVLVIL